MSHLLQSLWQANIEISLLLLIILLARFMIRKTTKIYNAYLLWLCVPVGLAVAKLLSQVQLRKPPLESVNQIVHSYIVQPTESFDTWLLLGYLWLSFALALLLRLVYQHIRLRRDLAKISVDRADSFAGLKIAASSKYTIIAIDQEDFSPAVYGFFKPKIFFPIHLLNTLSEDQIRLIINHEEHHIQQQHLWLNLLWDVLVCLMWFNPLVYVSRQNFRHDQELFCDYLVLNNSNQHQHKSYGLALLSTISATHSVSLRCSWKAFDQLEERIMNIKRPASFSSKLLLSISGIAIVSCTAFYTVNAAEYSAQESVYQEIHNDGETVITLTESEALEKELRQAQRERRLEQAQFVADERAHRKEQTRIQQIERDHEKAMRIQERELHIAERQARKEEQREHAKLRRLEAQHQKNQQKIAVKLRQHERQLFNSERKRREFESQQQKFEFQWQELAVQQEEFETQWQEFETQLQEYEIVPQDVQWQLQEFAKTEHDFKRDFHHQQFGDKERCETEKSLALASKQFDKESGGLKPQLQQAREEINKARMMLNKQRAKVELPTVPLTPIAPLPPEEPLAPLAPVSPLPPELPLASSGFKGVIPIPNEKGQAEKPANKSSRERREDADSFDFSQPH